MSGDGGINGRIRLNDYDVTLSDFRRIKQGTVDLGATSISVAKWCEPVETFFWVRQLPPVAA